MTVNADLGSLFGLVETYTRVNTRKTNVTATVRCIGRMEVVTKANGFAAFSTDMVA
jgi:hypothetical protein